MTDRTILESQLEAANARAAELAKVTAERDAWHAASGYNSPAQQLAELRAAVTPLADALRVTP
jgi:hypothetical protein